MNQPQTCSPTGTWTAGAPCSGQTCYNGACTGVCAPGQVGCSGNAPESCNAMGGFTVGSPCTNQTCVSGACQGSCAPGQTNCDATNNYTQTCNASGGWADNTACTPQNKTCMGGACVGSCAPGQGQCTTVLQPQFCDAGAWQSGTQCAVSCGDGGVCNPPMCAAAADAAPSQCPSGDNCCTDPTTYAASCASSCTPPTSALDCTGNRGSDGGVPGGECPAGTVCYGILVTNGAGLIFPGCTFTSFTSSCQTSVPGENPPGVGTSCAPAGTPATFNLRLCNARADCAGDPRGTLCCSYNGSPVHWCTTNAGFVGTCIP
jgi:hypothetical protein